jgi:hypothetical protein
MPRSTITITKINELVKNPAPEEAFVQRGLEIII